MPGDLASGFYPLSSPIKAALGMVNALQSGDGPARSNAEYLGFGGWTDGALAATGVLAAVAIPVDWGQQFTKVSIFVGATGEGTGSHAFAALYSGIAVPALLAQSADTTGATAIAASARFDFTLASTVLASPTNAPNGFLYAGVAITATQVPTAAVVSTPTAVGYQLSTNAPLFFSATAGSALGATAAATIASPTAKAVAPIVVLS